MLAPLVTAPPRPCLAQRPMEPRDSRSDPAAEPRSDAELERNRWSITGTARQLGLSRSSLYRKLKKHGIRFSRQ